MIGNVSKKLLEYAIQEAIQARKFAYAPYSHYTVGAALLLENGVIVTGANVENSSYGETVCAERVAIFNWKTHYSETHRNLKPVALVFATDSLDFSTPCGACLQVMLEFLPAETIIGHHNGRHTKFHTFGEILPFTHKVEVLTS